MQENTMENNKEIKMQDNTIKKRTNEEIEKRKKIQNELDDFLIKNEYYSLSEFKDYLYNNPFKFIKILYNYFHLLPTHLYENCDNSNDSSNSENKDIISSFKKMEEMNSELVDVFLRHLKKEEGAVRVLEKTLEKNGLSIKKGNSQNDDNDDNDDNDNEEDVNKDYENFPSESFTKIALPKKYFLNHMLKEWRAEHFYNFFKLLNYTSFINKNVIDKKERCKSFFLGLKAKYYEINSFLGLSKRAFYSFMSALTNKYKVVKKAKNLASDEHLIENGECKDPNYVISRDYFLRKGDKVKEGEIGIFIYNSILANIDSLFKRNYHAFRLYIYLLFYFKVKSSKDYKDEHSFLIEVIPQIRESLKFRSNKDVLDNGINYLKKIGLIKFWKRYNVKKKMEEIVIVFNPKPEFCKMENPYANYYKEQHILEKQKQSRFKKLVDLVERVLR